MNNGVILSPCLPRWVCRALLGSFLGVAILQGGSCSKKSTTAEVSGSVTVDGEPAENGSIGFFPADGKSPTSGGVIKAGRYLAQVPFGEAKVEIRISKVVGQKKLYNTPDSKMKSIMVEVLPEKYNDQTELRIDVQPGANEQNFDLESKK